MYDGVTLWKGPVDEKFQIHHTYFMKDFYSTGLS